MCTGKEIYCQDNRCQRLVGWHILEPCKESKFCDFPSQHASSDGGLGWGLFHCYCNELKITQRQRSKHRTCAQCIRRRMDRMAANLKIWAESEREEPEGQEEAVADNLMNRRRKRASRDEGDGGEGDKKRAPVTDPVSVFNFEIDEWPISNNAPDSLPISTNPFDPSSMSTPRGYFHKTSTYHVATLGSDQLGSIAYQGGLNFEDFIAEDLGLQMASSQEAEPLASDNTPILLQEQTNETAVAAHGEVSLPADDFQISVLGFDESIWNTIMPSDSDFMSNCLDNGPEDGSWMYPSIR